MSVWDEVLAARAKAHAKHGENSIEAVPAGDPRWLPILVEEYGEHAEAQMAATLGRIGRSMTYDQDVANVRGELIDMLAVTSAWVDAIDQRQARLDQYMSIVAGLEIAPPMFPTGKTSWTQAETEEGQRLYVSITTSPNAVGEAVPWGSLTPDQRRDWIEEARTRKVFGMEAG